MMLNSRTPHWEELRASMLLQDKDFLAKLNVEPIFAMLERPPTAKQDETLAWMLAEGFIVREPAGGGYVTTLGAIAAARKLADFPDLSRKAARVVVYDGFNKAKTKQEQEGAKGYAISFQGLMQFVMSLLPQSEVIEKALRKKTNGLPGDRPTRNHRQCADPSRLLHHRRRPTHRNLRRPD